jgi:hypothetical protein
MLKRLLNKHPKIFALFEGSALDDVHDETVPRFRRLPLINLLDPHTKRSALLLSALEDLVSIKASLRDTISDLQSTDWPQVNAAARELETYALLKLNGLNPQWKPSVTSGKVPDLMVEYKNHPVYIEIYTVHPAKSVQEEEDASSELQSWVSSMPDNPYVILVKKMDKSGLYTAEMLEPCILFLQEKIKRGVADARDEFSEVFEFQPVNKSAIAVRFKFIRHPTGKKGYIGSLTRTGHGDDSGRLKSKILDKIDGGQLDEKMRSSGAVNVLYIIIDDYYGLYSLPDAVLGTECLEFDPFDNDAQARAARKDNGIVNDKKGRAALLGSAIDAVVAVSAAESYECVQNESCPLTRDDLISLFNQDEKP